MHNNNINVTFVPAAAKPLGIIKDIIREFVMKLICVVLTILCVTGCASIQPLGNITVKPLKNCNVRVFSSLEAAKANGEIEELCMITGTSSGSFSHTVGTAIQKHKDNACECGADNVYIQTQDAGTLGTASVSLIAFRYKNIGK